MRTTPCSEIWASLCFNGYQEQTLETRLGTLDRRIPKLRTGSNLPISLEPRKE